MLLSDETLTLETHLQLPIQAGWSELRRGAANNY